MTKQRLVFEKVRIWIRVSGTHKISTVQFQETTKLRDFWTPFRYAQYPSALVLIIESTHLSSLVEMTSSTTEPARPQGGYRRPKCGAKTSCN